MDATDLPAAQLREMDAQTVLQNLLRAGHPCLVAYSGGKDSTIALSLTLNAAVAAKEAGDVVPPIIVTHGNTGIENPTVSALAHHELAKVRKFGTRHGLNIRAEVAEPALNDTWAVSVLSGRKLPTFANSSSRDCTIAYKIHPMVRLRKKLLKEVGSQRAKPVTIIGTRFEESTERAARMAARRESATLPWEKDGAMYLSPIAEWTSDDVWESIGRMRTAEMPSFTNGDDVFELYAAGGGTSCAVVSDMATEGAKKSRACGARFGCSLCAAVGRDKSLENMLEADPKYAWLRGLNRIQRFLVDTQYDFDRRNWLGRSIDADGFIKVTPDTYSPAMLADLLRYCLTVDADEREAAAKEGLDGPRFQLVSKPALIAIDAFWGLHALQDSPFAAVAIWQEVNVRGKRFYPPENVIAYPVRGFPAVKYIYVGDDWDQGTNSAFSGLRDVLAELSSPDTEQTQVLKGGRRVLKLDESDMFEVDEEGASLFLEWEAERVVSDAANRPQSSSRTFFYYANLGIISTSKRHAGMLDSIARRANWRRSMGLAGPVKPSAIKTMAISKQERDYQVEMMKGSGEEMVGPVQELPLRMRLCHPVYL